MQPLPPEGSLRYRLKEAHWRLASLFPDSAEGRLWSAVLLLAAEDADAYVAGHLNHYFAAEARHYLLGMEHIPACDLCDVDSHFARRELTRIGLLR